MTRNSLSADLNVHNSLFPSRPRPCASPSIHARVLVLQVSSIKVSTIEKDGGVFAISMSLATSSDLEGEVDMPPPMLFAQSLIDPGYFGGSMDVPGDTRCFTTAPSDVSDEKDIATAVVHDSLGKTQSVPC